jgi:RimJ/RimL family protein N-acetyltransferase
MLRGMRDLETRRLLIRAFTTDDLPAFRELRQEEAADDALAVEQLTYCQLADSVTERLGQPPLFDRAIVLKGDGRLLGSVGFVPCVGPFGQLLGFGGKPSKNQLELGLYWTTHPGERGHGYASEAARAMVDYAFESLGIGRIVAVTEHTNAASIAVMRSLDMRIERNPQNEPSWFQTVGILDARSWSAPPKSNPRTPPPPPDRSSQHG